MNYKIDNLQYCNWSRKIFEKNRSADLDAVNEMFDLIEKKFGPKEEV